MLKATEFVTSPGDMVNDALIVPFGFSTSDTVPQGGGLGGGKVP
jgi:hypothetical protein